MTLISQLGFPLVAEWTRSQSKAMVIMLITCAISIGQMMLGGLAFAFREWRTLQLVVSVPFFVFSFSSRYEHLSHCVLCSCILDLVCAWDFALANCRCIDLVRKIVQTHLENVKILIKLGNCLFSLLAV